MPARLSRGAESAVRGAAGHLLGARGARLAPPAASAADAELPNIGILGRPNVGKSTLFNRLTGRHGALVRDTPASHVTRDWKAGVGSLSDLRFRVLDTSGLEPFMSAASIQGRATAMTRQARAPSAFNHFLALCRRRHSSPSLSER